MKVIILAGGKGTRISEYTKIIPKPMIKIGNKPILIHIMQHFLKLLLKMQNLLRSHTILLFQQKLHS